MKPPYYKSSLPRLTSKRISTEPVTPGQHRFSRQLQKPGKNRDLDCTLEALRDHPSRDSNGKNKKKSISYGCDQSLFELIGKRSLAHRALREGRHKTEAPSQTSSLLQDPHKNTENVPRSHILQKIEFSEVSSHYHSNIKGRNYSVKSFLEFVALLRGHNPVFQKISPVVAESLVKLGFIRTYEAGDMVYKQGASIRNLGLLLWGKTVLRKKQTKFKFNCSPGAAFGEQLILEGRDYSQKSTSNLEKGEFRTFERCRASEDSGVLFIGEQQYKWMFQELALQGFKDLILCFQSLIQRTYLRKRQQRQLNG